MANLHAFSNGEFAHPGHDLEPLVSAILIGEELPRIELLETHKLPYRRDLVMCHEK